MATDSAAADTSDVAKPDPMLAVANSPLFSKIPMEIRERIYSFVVGTEQILAIQSRVRSQSNDDIIVRIIQGCRIHGTAACDRFQRSSSLWFIPGSNNRTLLETALLFTSRAFYAEVLHFILRENIIEFWPGNIRGELVLPNFGPYLRSIRRLLIHSDLPVGPLGKTNLTDLRHVARCLEGLQELVVHGCANYDANYEGRMGFKVHEVVLLNYFRPLAQLPLKKAMVLIKAPGEINMSIDPAYVNFEEKARRVELQATAMLLRNPSDPEEPQVDRPAYQLEVIRKYEKEKLAVEQALAADKAALLALKKACETAAERKITSKETDLEFLGKCPTEDSKSRPTKVEVKEEKPKRAKDYQPGLVRAPSST